MHPFNLSGIVKAGGNITVDDIVYEPPRNGSTLWEIGIPDRVASEFYIPDPNPKYVNKLYLNHTDRLKILVVKFQFE